MVDSFPNAPLLELVVEVRWPSPLIGRQPPTPSLRPPILVGDAFERFLEQFASAMAKHGFVRTERLVPNGMPVVPYLPVLRLRSDPDSPIPVLYQVGLGMFSANAVRPYKSWGHFRQFVVQGIEALIAARDGAEATIPFTPVVMRYIDGFREDYLQNRSPGQFLEEVLGFRIQVPHAVATKLRTEPPWRPVLQLAAKSHNGLDVEIAAGEGLIEGIPSAIVDTMSSVTEPVPPDVHEVMSALDTNWRLIHEMFLEWSQPVRDLMERESS